MNLEIISIVLLLIAFLFYFERNKYFSKLKKKNISEQEDTEKDINTISDTQYLLEAGTNKWRLHSKYYDNYKAMCIYSIGLLFNNTFFDYEKERLESLKVKARLAYLLYMYTDEDESMEVRIKQLTSRLIKRINKIPKVLQEKYKLSKLDSDTSSEYLVNTLTFIFSDEID